LTSIRKSVLVAHSTAQIYDLIERVEDYPQFLPWCNYCSVHERSQKGMQATLGIGLGGINQRFTTINHHYPTEKITLKLKDGPFKSLSGQWLLVALAQDACKVSLELDYQFANGIIERLVAPVFDPIAASLIDAFVTRADQVYGQ
jgi:ribosome-associated toxin RatA of RatAB toxin-antitoxin module